MLQENTLLLDGQTKAMFLSEYNGEGFVSTLAGSMWFIDWEMMATLKINSFHENSASLCKFAYKYVTPNEFLINEKLGDEVETEFNLKMSSSSDGILKLWNMHTSEQIMQFVVPKESCT